MKKISETLKLKKIETLMENVHTAWYSHLFKDKDQIILSKKYNKKSYWIVDAD